MKRFGKEWGTESNYETEKACGRGLWAEAMGNLPSKQGLRPAPPPQAMASGACGPRGQLTQSSQPLHVSTRSGTPPDLNKREKNLMSGALQSRNKIEVAAGPLLSCPAPRRQEMCRPGHPARRAQGWGHIQSGNMMLLLLGPHLGGLSFSPLTDHLEAEVSHLAPGPKDGLR